MVMKLRASRLLAMIRSAATSSVRGDLWIWLSDSISPFSSAMYRAADVPLPDTSAISTPSRRSSIGNRS